MTQPRSTFPLGKIILPIITLVLAVIALAVGAVMTSSSIAALNTSLSGAQPTAADVYGGQSLIGVSGSILGAGIVGVLLSLAALGIVIALVPRQVDELVVFDELEYDDLDGVDDGAPQVPAAPAPVVAPTAEQPFADQPVASAPVVDEPAAAPVSEQPVASAPVTEEPDVETTTTETAANRDDNPAR
ncbi:hypothetical protein [Glaciibacter flavus]|uniref:hypothetical protein n=1 Tax=Orlajensenia flava TaxID=2565934 RepID=UPI003AFF9788